MTETRYGKYIQKLSFEEGGTGLYRQVTKLNGAPFGVDVQIEYGDGKTCDYRAHCSSSTQRPRALPFDHYKNRQALSTHGCSALWQQSFALGKL